MKYIVFLTTLLVSFTSCKTCIECECSKNGVKAHEEDCLYTNDKMDAARNFSDNLKREKGYVDCICTY